MTTSRSNSFRLICTALVAACLGACGLKGDLYLPETEPAAPVTNPADESEEESRQG